MKKKTKKIKEFVWTPEAIEKDKARFEDHFKKLMSMFHDNAKSIMLKHKELDEIFYLISDICEPEAIRVDKIREQYEKNIPYDDKIKHYNEHFKIAVSRTLRATLQKESNENIWAVIHVAKIWFRPGEDDISEKIKKLEIRIKDLNDRREAIYVTGETKFGYAEDFITEVIRDEKDNIVIDPKGIHIQYSHPQGKFANLWEPIEKCMGGKFKDNPDPNAIKELESLKYKYGQKGV